MDHLAASFQDMAYITTVSSLGFHTLANAHDFEMPTYTLKEQTEHKAHYLRQEALHAHDLPIVVCGHSIGLHMAMKALEIIEHREAASPAMDTASTSDPLAASQPIDMTTMDDHLQVRTSP
jgi:hypothetical protein